MFIPDIPAPMMAMSVSGVGGVDDFSSVYVVDFMLGKAGRAGGW